MRLSLALRKTSLPGLLIMFSIFWKEGRPFGAEVTSAHKPLTTESLSTWISNRISQPKYDAAWWGIQIESVATGRKIFQHNAHKLFSPASNMKLFTVAGALNRLGAEYRVETSIRAHVRPDAAGVLKGDLIIYGRGDPTVTSYLHGDSSINALKPLVQAIKDAGIRRVTGDLVGDESFFRGPEYGSGWAWDDLEYNFGAEISALSVNDNILKAVIQPGTTPGQRCSIQLEPACNYLLISNRTETLPSGLSNNVSLYRSLGQNTVFATGGLAVGGSNLTEEIPVHAPAGLFLHFLRALAEQEGIEFEGGTRVASHLERIGSVQAQPQELVELGCVKSLCLGDIAREILKRSQNLYADLLLSHLGELSRKMTDGHLTSEQLGIREISRFLTDIGIEQEEFYFEEGSGLSRNTLVTPNATVSLLKHMRKARDSAVFMQSLPVAGVDGTLRNRMRQTPAAGNVRAKTGRLRWASSLSGYVTTASGEQLVFAIMLNRYQAAPGCSPGEDLDAIAIELASFTGESR